MYMHVVAVIKEALEKISDTSSAPAEISDEAEVLEFAPVQEGEE